MHLFSSAFIDSNGFVCFVRTKMPNGDLPQGMYTPIPQNMTDSESEEEFHLQSHVRSSIKLNAQTNAMGNAANCNRYTDHERVHIDSMPDVRYANSYLGNHTDAPSNHFHGLNDADNVAILNTNLRKGQPMSSMRKLCFVVTLFVCVLTVVLFVWVLPCTNGSCTTPSEHTQTHNWLRNYERVELKGTINVVRGVRGRGMNLVLMYRGNKIFVDEDDSNQSVVKRNGIIALMGANGQVGWFDEMVNEPSIIDCSLLDVDANGETDCLVIDEFGEIGALNPVSGTWLWHVAEKTSNDTDKLSFPLVLPDIDHDGIKDLLIVCAIDNGTYNTLKLISGASGRAIGGSYTITKCSYIHKFQLDANLKISYNCIKNDTENRETKPLSELHSLMFGRAAVFEAPHQAELSQHKFYGQRKDTISQRNIYSVSGKQLIVENNGVCPDACNVSVTLLDEQNGKPIVIRNFNGTHMYGMVPARLSFKKSSDPSKTAVHGFVIKFWEWGTNKSTNSARPTSINASKNNSSEFNKFDSILRKKRAWNLPNTKVMMPNKSIDETISSVKFSMSTLADTHMRLIKETVVLIVFNSTDIRIENTSQSNIIQFCRIGDNSKAEVCQPDLNYQENSVLIADLDQDGSQELVSYYSTFVESDGQRNKWKLMTYVQLLRLESELPKLYAIDEKH